MVDTLADTANNTIGYVLSPSHVYSAEELELINQD